MKQILSDMLERYEQGKVSRRELISALAAVAGAAGAAPAGSTFRGLALNHIAIRVTNVQRSRDFYQKHFGLSVAHESAGDCFLNIGKNFLTLFRNQNAGLDHFCLAIEGFKPDAAVEEIKRQGLRPTRPAGSDRVYFPDPDGLTVQVSSIDHGP